MIREIVEILLVPWMLWRNEISYKNVYYSHVNVCIRLIYASGDYNYNYQPLAKNTYLEARIWNISGSN